jgi:hypothetical protein
VIHDKRTFKEFSQCGAWANENLFTTVFNSCKFFYALQADHLMRMNEAVPHPNQKVGSACIESRARFVFKDLPELI